MPEYNNEFFVEMRKRLDRAVEQERDIREQFDLDLKFVIGEQWDERIKAQRSSEDRPCLTINMLPEKVQQIVNAVRMNKPAGKVSPVDEGADKDTAEVLQGIGRHIEYHSQSSVAYETAFEYAASGGFGYWRYGTEYVAENTFDQDIILEPISDPTSVYLDCDCKKSDGSDARWAFILEEIHRDEHRRRWPNAEVVSGQWPQELLNRAGGWFKGDYVRIAEYWFLEELERELLLRIGSDGNPRPVFADQFDESMPPGEFVTGPDGLRRSRTVKEITVKWIITNGVETLEEPEWLGRYIPIVRVTGKELTVSGKKHFISAIRHTRDPQQLLNYTESASAEACMLSPKAPFIGYLGQFKTKEREWATANIKNWPYLEIDPVTVGGQPAPFPIRNQYEPPIQALSLLGMRAQEHIKSATGIYDPSLGRQEEQRSGKAISLLQRAGDIANFHLVDNLTRSIWHGWRILIDLIPKIYDTPRQVRILGPDEAERIVRVNEQFRDPDTGELVKYDLGIGRYDVAISVGASFATKREEQAANIQAFGQAAPGLLPLIADLYVKAMDWPDADKIAERLIPPQFAQQELKGIKIHPLVGQYIQQIEQQRQELVDELNQQLEIIDKKKLEIESRERIAAEGNKTQLLIAELKALSETGNKALARIDVELANLNRRLDLLGQWEPIMEEPAQTIGPQTGAAGAE